MQEQEEPNPDAGRGESYKMCQKENIPTFSGEQKTDRLLNFRKHFYPLPEELYKQIFKKGRLYRTNFKAQRPKWR